MPNLNQAMHDLVSHTAPTANLAFPAYRMILSAPFTMRPALMRQFILEFKYTPCDGLWETESYLTDRERTGLMPFARRWVRSKVNELSASDLTEEEFDRRLWEAISSQAEHATETKRVALLAACALHPTLPYVQVSKALSMDDEEFDRAVKTLDPVLAAAVRHIFNLDMEQVTQDASLLLPLLEKCGSTREKQLLLSLILMRARVRIPGMDSSIFCEDDD